jgi:hypothetical protein
MESHYVLIVIQVAVTEVRGGVVEMTKSVAVVVE